MRHVIAKFLNIGEKSYYVWKNKTHINLINFLETYFTKNELEEYLQTNEIKKLELVKNLNYEEVLKISKILEKSIATHGQKQNAMQDL